MLIQINILRPYYYHMHAHVQHTATHFETDTCTMLLVNSVRRRKCYTAEASDTDHSEWK